MGKKVKKSGLNLHGPDAPAVGALVADAGKEGDAVLRGRRQHGVVRLADLLYAGDGVCPRPQLGSQLDGVSNVREFLASPVMSPVL